MNMMLTAILIAFVLFASVASMPYHVPLQGTAGGKRTLVLMDNLVIANRVL